MFKRRLLIFACLLLCVPTFADDNTNGVYVGTPKGFYDDIDPNSLDEDEDLTPPAQQQEATTPSQGGSNDVVIPPTKTKATKNFGLGTNQPQVRPKLECENIQKLQARKTKL